MRGIPMFAIDFFPKSEEPTTYDLFEAMDKGNASIVDQYFRVIFSQVKAKLIETQEANGEGHGQGDIDPAVYNDVIDSIVGEIPDFAVTDKNRDYLETLSERYSDDAFKMMSRLQRLDLKMGDKIKTAEEGQMYEALQSKVESLGVSRAVALRLSVQIQDKLDTQNKPTVSACTIL